MGMAAPTYYTAEMVRAFPEDGNRYEVVRGELLVTPAPRPWHEVIVVRLVYALESYLRRFPFGQVFASHSDISWASDVLVQPDVFVAPLDEVRLLDWAKMKRLSLVIEVLSPSSLRADRFTKRVEYLHRGVPLYWIIDPDERRAEVWRPGDTFPGYQRHQLSWHPEGAADPFTIALSDLFSPL